jgi:hypothetical protein
MEELVISSLAQTDALAKLLIEKGLITREQFIQRISEERAMYQKLFNLLRSNKKFEKAVNEFVDPGVYDCVEVEAQTRRLRLGTGGLRFCETGTNPFT